MKRILLTALFALTTCIGAVAMSYERAREEALYLTDKMAYELNLNDQQYNDAYEINLDYFLSMRSEADLRADYYSYRLADFRCILHDWQYRLMMAADYFIRPIVWNAGGWHFPIYSYYPHGHYYYSRPSAYGVYRGGHSRFHYSTGFYAHRRPAWNGGMRGHDMHRPSSGIAHRTQGMTPRPRVGYRIGDGRGTPGRDAHVNMNGSRRSGSVGNAGRGNMPSAGQGFSGGRNGGPSRGNSFDGSSSRMSGNRGVGTGAGTGGNRSGNMGAGGVGRGNSGFGGGSRNGGMGGAGRGAGRGNSSPGRR